MSPTPALLPAFPKPAYIVRRVEVGGYWVEVIPYHRGGFIATATDRTGNVAMDTIHETANDAVATAMAWASANPCDGSSPFEPGAAVDLSTPFDDTTDPRPLGVHTGGPASPAGREDEAASRSAGDEVQELRARLALVETRLAAALARAPEDLAKHQGRRAGEELPAAPLAKAGKPRGRRPKGGAK